MSTAQFGLVQIEDITPSLTNPRRTFNDAALIDMADSIRQNGVLQPILVRPLPPHRVADTPRNVIYEIVAGERRWRASGIAKQAAVPVIIKHLTDIEVLECQVIENLQREDITELEEANGFDALIREGYSVEFLAQKIGKSRRHVFNRIKLLDLCPEAAKALLDGKISATTAMTIAAIPSHTVQARALADVAGLKTGVEELIKTRYMLRLTKFDTSSGELGAIPCTVCDKRTKANPDLFAAENHSADLCLDIDCYTRKTEAAQAQKAEAARAAGKTVITGTEAIALMPPLQFKHSKIDGYLRLDDTADSPVKGKTIRKLLSEVDWQQTTPETLIETRSGELVAALPEQIAINLLRSAGHISDLAQVGADALDRLIEKTEAKAADKAQSAQAAAIAASYEKELKLDIIDALPHIRSRDTDELTHLFIDFLVRVWEQRATPAAAKILCKALGINSGIAHKEAVTDRIKSFKLDTSALAYMHLMQLALTIDAATLEIQDNIQSYVKAARIDTDQLKRYAIAEHTEDDSPPCSIVQPTAPAPSPLAHSQSRGGGKPKKLSAQDAATGIAHAMQGLEAASAAADAAAEKTGTSDDVQNKEATATPPPPKQKHHNVGAYIKFTPTGHRGQVIKRFKKGGQMTYNVMSMGGVVTWGHSDTEAI